MTGDPSATWLLEQETRALLTRLAAVEPFVLQETLRRGGGAVARPRCPGSSST